MAERRMFAKTIIDSDAFLDMPLSSQSLYFHLSMRADDDGFINNPKKIQRMIGASDDDAKLLKAKNFILSFETGVIVIKHWRVHNYIQKDRYKPTVYEEEKSELAIKNNNVYTMDTECIQDGSTGKVRLGEVRLEEDKPKKRKRSSIEKPDGVSDAVWNDFNKQRKTKLTQTALNGIIKQANLAGFTLEEALTEAVERGWQSFKADWVNKPQAQPFTRQSTVLSSSDLVGEKSWT